MISMPLTPRRGRCLSALLAVFLLATLGSAQTPYSPVVIARGPGTSSLDLSAGIVSGDGFGRSVAILEDRNGDGFREIAVGVGRDEPNISDMEVEPSSVEILDGRTGQVLDSIYVSDTPGFGFALERIDDVNGDGTDDLLVGAPYALTETSTHFVFTPTGYAFVLSGATLDFIRYIEPESPNGLDFIETGFAVAALGDLNGDGVGEYAVGEPEYRNASFARTGRVRVFSGATGSLWFEVFGPNSGSARWRFGATVEGVGDVDGDGVADVAVGSPRQGPSFSATHGFCRVYSGATGGLVLSIPGPSDSGRFGSSIASLGDLNGDGRADLAIGAPRVDGIGSDSGAVRVHSGIDGSLMYSVTGLGAFNFLGATIAATGDIDGDGLGDFATLAEQAGDPIHVHSGLDGSILAVGHGGPQSGPGLLIPNQGFGALAVGDIDGDGATEIVAGFLEDTTGFYADGFVVTYTPATRPGTGDDLRLDTGVNSLARGWAENSALPGDLFDIRLTSPAGTFAGEVPVLVLQLFTDAQPINQPAGFPEVWVNPSPFEAFPVIPIYDGNEVSFGAGLLPADGLAFTAQIPSGLAGFNAMVQGFALATSGQPGGNGLFTATDAHVVHFD